MISFNIIYYYLTFLLVTSRDYSTGAPSPTPLRNDASSPASKRMEKVGTEEQSHMLSAEDSQRTLTNSTEHIDNGMCIADKKEPVVEGKWHKAIDEDGKQEQAAIEAAKEKEKKKRKKEKKEKKEKERLQREKREREEREEREREREQKEREERERKEREEKEQEEREDKERQENERKENERKLREEEAERKQRTAAAASPPKGRSISKPAPAPTEDNELSQVLARIKGNSSSMNRSAPVVTRPGSNIVLNETKTSSPKLNRSHTVASKIDHGSKEYLDKRKTIAAFEPNQLPVFQGSIRPLSRDSREKRLSMCTSKEEMVAELAHQELDDEIMKLHLIAEEKIQKMMYRRSRNPEFFK